MERTILGSFLAGATALLGCMPVGTQGCGSDSECAAGRVCEQGVCVDRETSSGSADGSETGDGTTDDGTGPRPTTDPSGSGSDGSDDTDDGSSETGFEGDPVATDCDTCLSGSNADDRTLTCQVSAGGPQTQLVFSGDRPVSYDGMGCGPVVWTDVFTQACIAQVTCGSCDLDLSTFASSPGDWDVIVACAGGVFASCPTQTDTPVATGPGCLNCGDDGLHYCDGDQLRRCTDDELVLDCVGQQECWPVPASPGNCWDQKSSSSDWSGPGCYNVTGSQATCLP